MTKRTSELITAIAVEQRKAIVIEGPHRQQKSLRDHRNGFARE